MQNISADIVKCFFTFQLQLKLYHWQTMSYSRHKATDDLNSSLLDFIDKFIESFQGKYGRVSNPGSVNIDFNINDDNATEDLLENFSTFLDKLYKILEEDNYLLNQIDEIKTEINKTIYKFSLK